MNDLDDARELKLEAERATQAGQILNNPLYIEAITIMRADAIGLFQHAKQSDSKAHKEAWLKLDAITEFEENLKSIMQNGVFAQENLTMLDKVKNIVGL